MIEAKIEVTVMDDKNMSVIALENMVHSSLTRWIKENDTDLKIAGVQVISIHPEKIASY